MSDTKSLEQQFFESKIGKYEIVKLAIEWIQVKKNDEEYRKLQQPVLLDKIAADVLSGEATWEKIEEIKKKKQSKEKKEEDK